MFLQISDNSQENTCAKDSLLMKLQIIQSFTLSKKKFRHRCFLVNSAKILMTFLKSPSDGYFCIRSVYFPSTTFCFFKNDITHIFRLSIFSAKFIDLEQEQDLYFKPLATLQIPTQSNIWDGAFSSKIVDSLKPLIIFAKKLTFSTRF